MNAVHPMLTNIRALASPAAWQKSIDLAEHTFSSGLKVPRTIQQIYLVGHGTSLYNGLVGEYLFEHIAGIRAKAISAFAFSMYVEKKLLGSQTLVIGISTTGETQSVCDALNLARRAGAVTLAVTAHGDSAITHQAGTVLLTGGEDDQISVKTKSYVQALVGLYVLAAYLTGDSQIREYWKDQIRMSAQYAQHLLDGQWTPIRQLAERYGRAPKVFVLGTGPNLGTAEEASLKVIEMAKMYSECQELEDFFHGRLREVDSSSPLVFVAPQGPSIARVLDFLTVADIIRAPSIVITDQVTAGIQRLATHVIHIPVKLDEYATPLLYILPLYIFGYEMALQRGQDPAARRYNIVPQTVRYSEETRKASD